ncbi:hypothetical protein ACHAW5_004942 [Stephanodiscus triporus]|uniref:Uncharacterized protein n=1 Tax=Stephanodiscus triporus TaxID=2934178 RepID=A0ABD3N7Q9_9STRA
MKASFVPMTAVSLSCVLTKETLAFDSSPTNEGGGDTNIIARHTDSAESKNLNDGDSVDDSDDNNCNSSGSNRINTSSSFTTSSSTKDGADSSRGNGNTDSSRAHPHGSSGHSAYYYNADKNKRINANYDDEQTYLDLFGERAKELLTQHVIPTTDAECHWDWRMGRCEPYCVCAYQFLWGDYHLGRSCRYRLNPPPPQFAIDEADDSSNEEPSWQEAWQEVWQAQSAKGSSTFAPPKIPKSHRESADTTSWDPTSTTCTHPPESMYIRLIHRLTNYVARSNVVLEQFQKLKSASSKTVDAGMVHGRNHLTNMRQKACETVKMKVEERAKGRNQPVVLTRQGATWIRRVCGAGDGSDVAMRQNLPREILEDISKDWQ